MNFPKVSRVMSSTEVLKVGLCHSPLEIATITHTCEHTNTLTHTHTHTHTLLHTLIQGDILYPLSLLVYSGAVCNSAALIFAGMQRATFDHHRQTKKLLYLSCMKELNNNVLDGFPINIHTAVREWRC